VRKSIRPWVGAAELAAADFKPADLFQVDQGARLARLPRGTQAASLAAGIQAEAFQIHRYAGELRIDEQDIFNGLAIRVVDELAEEFGRAARRVRSDLVWAKVLGNPTLADDATCAFDAAQQQPGAVTISEAALDAALAAIGVQSLADPSGAVAPEPAAEVLIVATALVGKARRFVRNMELADQDSLQVLAESRLAAEGVVDPQSGSVVAGWDTGWLLAAGADQRPSVAVLALDGKFEPTVSEYDLDQGQWGKCYSANCDIGVAVVTSVAFT
jgi:hypothetical protein